MCTKAAASRVPGRRCARLLLRQCMLKVMHAFTYRITNYPQPGLAVCASLRISACEKAQRCAPGSSRRHPCTGSQGIAQGMLDGAAVNTNRYPRSAVAGFFAGRDRTRDGIRDQDEGSRIAPSGAASPPPQGSPGHSSGFAFPGPALPWRGDNVLVS